MTRLNMSCSDLHIVFVPSWYPTTLQPIQGIFFRDQARALAREGVRVGVIYPELASLRGLSFEAIRDSHFQTVVSNEGEVPTVRLRGWNPFLPTPRRWLFTYFAERLFQTYVNRFGRPHVIHAQSSLWGGHAAREISRHYGIPYVVTEHYSKVANLALTVSEGQFVRRAFADATRVYAVSHALARRARPLFEDCDVKIVPNLVDTDFFTLPPPGHRSHTGPLRFLSVGSLEPGKGMGSLIEAFAAAFDDSSEAVLDIVGGGSLHGNLLDKIRKLGASKAITLHGPLARSEVRGRMWKSDVFVLASDSETFGVVLIEAMATGLPVLATRSGGPEDVVTEEVGWMVDAQSEEALTDALRIAMISPLLYRSPAIRRYVLSRFSASTVANTLITEYMDVVEE